MKKKMLTFLLGAMMIAGVMCGCGGSEDANDKEVNNEVIVNDEGKEEDVTPSTITVKGAYGEVEVPYAPERICVLDMNTMDMIHTLGLGEKVVSLAYNKKHTTYLIDYYSSETIVSLTVSSRNQEEGADPYEAYYSIDADMIIGDADAISADAYAVLSQIAPTVVIPNSEESSGMYESVMEKSAIVASIWGKDDEMASIRETYDAKYAKLVEECEGKTYVLGGGDAEGLQSFRLATTVTENSSKKSDDSEKSDNSEKSSGGSNKVANTTAINAFLSELKMTNITDTAPEEVRTEALAELDNDAAAKKMMEWIESVKPTGVFVTQRSYETYEDVLNAGYEYLYLDTLTCSFAILGTEWTQLSGGLTGMMTMVDQLTDALID